MFTWVIFEDIENGHHSLHIEGGLQYLKGRKYNFRDRGELIQCCITQLMRVEKLAWPSLNANRDRIYGKFSRITL